MSGELTVEEVFQKGVRAFQNKDAREAILCWQACIDRSPSYLPAFERLAYLYVLLQEYELARETALQLIEYDPDRAEGHLYLSLSLIHLQDKAGARTAFETALGKITRTAPQRISEWKGYWRDHKRLARKRRMIQAGQRLFSKMPVVSRSVRNLVRVLMNGILRLYAPRARKAILPTYCIKKSPSTFSVLDYLNVRRRYLSEPEWRMTYARVAESLLHSEVIGMEKGKRVVDVGTGTSFLPLYWALRGVSVTATDPDDFVLRLKPLAEKMGLQQALESGDLRIEVADGRELPFPDDSFDYWTCVSVIEHIPGTGDTQVIREAARVLKPGGIAVLTTEGGTNPEERWVPVEGYFGKQYLEDAPGSEERTSSSIEEFKDGGHSGSLALLREYDRERLVERLVKPSGMKLIELGFIDHRFPTNFRELVEKPDPTLSGLLLREVVPLVCYWSYRRAEDREDYQPRPGSTAYVILQKE